VALRFYLDTSALAKRYVVEQGTLVVNHLFRRVARDAILGYHKLYMRVSR
jgi:hypothetical protein